jgi:hypothetical protein
MFLLPKLTLKLYSWFSWVEGAPPEILRSPFVLRVAHVENHIVVRIAGLGEQAIEASKPGSRRVPQILNRGSPSHDQIPSPSSNDSLLAFARAMLRRA